ncbi:glycosyltransferase family 2 protein [Pseudoalteromonas luteoviolacea]|uniref:glycosyltransferase family 2 protein n=1 Tax=Pseudoalteromonas luteoviolacea TaxID=43657 RepID=UPI0006924CC6|nr:glycosyltransferase family 2 protein [Pseudoalteromonas luteoviolacea]
MSKKVSVLIPVYGVEKYLPEFLGRLKSQKINDVEYIIVNDASPDNSHNLITEEIKGDERFVYINKPQNEGLYAARQDAFDISTGEYIINLDPDDYVSESFIDDMYNFGSLNSLDIIVSNVQLISENSEIINNSKSIIRNENFLYDKDNLSSLISTPYATWCRMYKRSLLVKTGYRYVQGELFLTNYHFLKGVRSGFSSSSTYFYRIRDNSMSSTSRSSKKLSEKLSCESISDFSDKIEKLGLEVAYKEEYFLFNNLSFTKLVFISCVHNKDINKFKYMKKTISGEFPASIVNIIKNYKSIPKELLVFTTLEFFGLTRLMLYIKSKK